MCCGRGGRPTVGRGGFSGRSGLCAMSEIDRSGGFAGRCRAVDRAKGGDEERGGSSSWISIVRWVCRPRLSLKTSSVCRRTGDESRESDPWSPRLYPSSCREAPRSPTRIPLRCFCGSSDITKRTQQRIQLWKLTAKKIQENKINKERRKNILFFFFSFFQ